MAAAGGVDGHAVRHPCSWKASALAVSISTRLFLMCLLSMAMAGGLALGLVRWRFSEGTPRVTAVEAARVAALVRALAERFDAQGDWRFLPAEAEARSAWLRSSVAHTRTAAVEASATEASTLAQRIVLSDAAGRRLAGEQPGALLVAIASIDQRRWTIRSRHGVAGYLSVAVPQDPDDALTVAFLIQKQRGLALLAALAVVLAALAAAVVATSFRHSLRTLVGGARRLARGELEARIDLRRRDEFGELAQSFNELGTRLQAAAHSRRQWIADTSHELRTPLAVLQAQLEAMQDGVRPMAHGGLASMGAQLNALRALVDDLDQLARADVGTLQFQQQRLEVWAVVAAAWDASSDRLRGAGLELQWTPPTAPAMAVGDATRLGQVFRNLLENCARYTAPGGVVSLAGTVASSQLLILLDDSAPGVPDEVLHRLGERFYRVDPSRSREHGGSGLGLALSRHLVEAHGGHLSFERSPLGGLRVSLTLPLVRT